MKFLKCKILGILIIFLLICACAKEEQEEQKDACPKIESDLKNARRNLIRSATSDVVEKYKIQSEATAVLGSAHINIVKCLNESPTCNTSLKSLGQFYITNSEFYLARYKSWKAYEEVDNVWKQTPITDSSNRTKAYEDREKAREIRDNEIKNSPYASFHKKSSDNEARQAFREANVNVIKHCSQKTHEMVRPIVQY